MFNRIVDNFGRARLRTCLVIALIAFLWFGYRAIDAQVNQPPASVAAIQQEKQTSTATAPRGDTTESPAHKYFTDVVLIDQDGKQRRFYTDLLQGKVVIINSFFATCKGSCLPMNRNMEKIQDALGDSVGKDVNIISISVDPAVDTPARLKEYAQKLHSRPGWYFLTGEKPNVDFALKKLGQFVDKKDDHLNIFIIGNERTGLWKKAFGLAAPTELIKVVESVLHDRGGEGKSIN